MHATHCCVGTLSLEVLESLVRRGVRLGREAYAWDEPFCHDLALLGGNGPLLRLVVEPGALDGAVKLDLLLEIQLVFEVCKVSSQFLPVGVALLEGEALPDILVEELVYGCIAVDTSAGIAVPIP